MSQVLTALSKSSNSAAPSVSLDCVMGFVEANYSNTPEKESSLRSQVPPSFLYECKAVVVHHHALCSVLSLVFDV